VGFWITVSDALRELKKRGRSYKKQETVSVPIPFANCTDDEALARLRHDIAQLCLPAVQRGRKMRFSLSVSFPKTAAGEKALAGFERFLNTGAPTELDVQYVTRFAFKGWMARLFGPDRQPEKLVFRPTQLEKKKPIPVRLEALDSSRTLRVSFPYLEMFVEKAGRQQVTLSTKKGHSPFGLTVVLPRQAGNIRVTYKSTRGRMEANWIRDILVFSRTVGTEGIFRLVFLGTDAVLEVPAGVVAANQVPSSEAVALGEKAAEIHKRLRKYGRLMIPGGLQLTNRDAARIEHAYSIVTTGRCSSPSQGQMTFAVDRLQHLINLMEATPDGDLQVVLPKKESQLKVFNLTVPVTPKRTFLVKATPDLCAALRRQLDATGESHVQIELDGEGIDEYTEFAPTLLAAAGD
jgi:hypothetical protein